MSQPLSDGLKRRILYVFTQEGLSIAEICVAYRLSIAQVEAVIRGKDEENVMKIHWYVKGMLWSFLGFTGVGCFFYGIFLWYRLIDILFKNYTPAHRLVISEIPFLVLGFFALSYVLGKGIPSARSTKR